MYGDCLGVNDYVVEVPLNPLLTSRHERLLKYRTAESLSLGCNVEVVVV
jgi:hypothetical protein